MKKPDITTKEKQPMTTTSNTPLELRAVSSIKQDIDAIRQELNTMRLPDLVPLQLHVQHTTTEHALHNTTETHDYLRRAVEAVEAAKQAHARRGELNAKLRVLEAELSQAESLERIRLANIASNAMQELHNEFNLTAKQLCRIYQKMLIQSRRNSLVPGAATGVVGPFNLPGMAPAGWQGSTSEMIESNSLYWLLKEQEQAA